jgi:hypothetical protein
MPAGVAVAGYFALTGTAALVTAAVVNGAIAGALIGASGSAMSGGDIFKGALKGAIIGGVTGGVLKGASIAMAGEAAAGAAGTEVAVNAAVQAPEGISGVAGLEASDTFGSTMLGDTGNAALSEAGQVAQATAAGPGILQTPVSTAERFKVKPELAPTPGGVTPPSPPPANTASRDLLYAGTIQGAGAGLGAWSAARTKAGEDEAAREQAAATRAAAQPVPFRTAAPRINLAKSVYSMDNVNITAPTWAKYFLDSAGVKKGLLTPQGATP